MVAAAASAGSLGKSGRAVLMALGRFAQREAQRQHQANQYVYDRVSLYWGACKALARSSPLPIYSV
eukprot:10660840-Lingulodinium_polyedra.AAC.1